MPGIAQSELSWRQISALTLQEQLTARVARPWPPGRIWTATAARTSGWVRITSPGQLSGVQRNGRVCGERANRILLIRAWTAFSHAKAPKPGAPRPWRRGGARRGSSVRIAWPPCIAASTPTGAATGSLRLQTSLTVRNLLREPQLPLTIWFQAIYLTTQNKNNLSPLSHKRRLDVCCRIAWKLEQQKSELTSRRATRRIADVTTGREPMSSQPFTCRFNR
ncbi:hypothetical protein SAMN05421783_10512 [Thiocapsa roseopersicina]|uniref:Uncharacterized protein n=1 Tax=Thiocapsa roseopersicina TaxID=1058 RepID=A0A1H2UAD8_THIRO|nr:hypothetical protein SAMN05421783_10512 [Thiocapsa roseopersicina]